MGWRKEGAPRGQGNVSVRRERPRLLRNHYENTSQQLESRYAYTTPADHKTDYYRQHVTANTAATQQKQSLPNPA